MLNEYKPSIIDGNNLKELLNELKTKKPNMVIVDAFSRQLKELFFIKNTKFIGENEEKVLNYF